MAATLSAVLFLACVAWTGCSRPKGPVTAGDPAPDIELQDLSGAAARVADYRGKVVLLDFWATYCDACHASIPAFRKMQDAYRARGLEVLGVSIDTYTGNLPEYVKQNQMTYRVLLDPGNVMARAYGVRGLPAAFLIGRDGKVRNHWLGYTAGTVSEIESEVKAAL